MRLEFLYSNVFRRIQGYCLGSDNGRPWWNTDRISFLRTGHNDQLPHVVRVWLGLNSAKIIAHRSHSVTLAGHQQCSKTTFVLLSIANCLTVYRRLPSRFVMRCIGSVATAARTTRLRQGCARKTGHLTPQSNCIPWPIKMKLCAVDCAAERTRCAAILRLCDWRPFDGRVKCADF